EAIWEDAQLMEAFADGGVTYEDHGYWRAGRAIAVAFAPETVARFGEALDRLRAERPEVRVLLVEGVPGLGADERLERADHVLDVLRRGLHAERRGGRR